MLDDDKLAKVERAPGHNEVAMVWKVTIKTPCFPGGRCFILASNDIASSLGTFSLTDDRCFYLLANSGARIGLCQYVKVAWDDAEPQYVHLDDEGYTAIGDEQRVVNVERLVDGSAR